MARRSRLLDFDPLATSYNPNENPIFEPPDLSMSDSEESDSNSDQLKPDLRSGLNSYTEAAPLSEQMTFNGEMNRPSIGTKSSKKTSVDFRKQALSRSAQASSKSGTNGSSIDPKSPKKTTNPFPTTFGLRQLFSDQPQAIVKLSNKNTNTSSDSSGLVQQFSTLTFTPTIPPAPRMPDWVIVSGDTHFCNDRSLYTTYQQLNGIYLLRGEICGVGTVRLQCQIPQNIHYPQERATRHNPGEKELVLREVLHIPEFIYNGFQCMKAFPVGRTEISKSGSSGGRGFDKKERGWEQWYSEPWRGGSRLLLVGDEIKDPAWDFQEKWKQPNEDMVWVLKGVQLERLAFDAFMKQAGWLDRRLWKEVRYSCVEEDDIDEDEDPMPSRKIKRRASRTQPSKAKRPKGTSVPP